MIASCYRTSSASQFFECLDEQSITIGEYIGRQQPFRLRVIQLMSTVSNDPEQLQNKRNEIVLGVVSNVPLDKREELIGIVWCAVVTASESLFQHMEAEILPAQNICHLRNEWFKLIASAFVPSFRKSVSTETFQVWQQEFFCAFEKFNEAINA